MLSYTAAVSVFLFGMCIGSFMNVCIYRLPRSESLVRPRRSFCPQCRSDIKAYDNIPVLSYLLLKGRCRHCQATIPFRYPFVELMGGFFALCTYAKYGFAFESLVYFVFIASLIVITYIDIDHQIIPDVISLPGIPIFFLASLFIPAVTAMDSILGLLSGGGTLLLIAWVYQLLTKKEGMGGGDIKLLSMIGTLIGWKGVLFTIFSSSALGTACGMIVMLNEKKGMKLAIPFGPFLSLGAIAYIFFGTRIVDWYLNLMR